MKEDVNGVEAAGTESPENDAALRVTELEGRLAEKDQELGIAARRIQALEAELSGLNGKLAEGADRLEKALTSYRALTVKANPGIPEELISGESIEMIDASVDKAKSLVSRIRQEMEEQAARTRVPSGAPVRVPRDLSALTAREKIQYGIGGKK